MHEYKHLLTAAFVFVGISLSAGMAKADYICSADYTPLDTLGLGNSGYIRFTTYSGPDCTGSFMNVWNLCTTGATSTSCIQNASFHYTNAEILTQAAATREAITWNLRTSVYSSGCNGGGAGCAAHLEFYAN